MALIPKLTGLIPQKLNYRLFLAFLLLILLPYLILQSYGFGKVESSVEGQINRFQMNQLHEITETFKELESRLERSMVTLENDERIQDMVKHPENYEPSDRIRFFEERFESLQHFLAAGESVDFTLIDNKGNLYGTNSRFGLEEYDSMRSNKEFMQLNESKTFGWFLQSSGEASQVLALYSIALDENQMPFEWIRIRIDLQNWLDTKLRQLSVGQKLILLDKNGQILGETKSSMKLSEATQKHILEEDLDSSYLDRKMLTLANYNHIHSQGFYLVSLFPLDIFIGDLQQVRHGITLLFFLATLIFAIITFIISTSITKPLRLLQKKMNLMVDRNLKLTLPESGVKGEILDLHKAFNNMMNDIQQLVQRLSHEEKQKEASRFRMLLHQMNPHFLFNTLNSIKWMALDQGNRKIYEMCVSLGKILESTLNSEIDLVFVKDELDLARAYEHIQGIRYKNLFLMEYVIGDGLDYALMPKLCIQPLIENAITHGFSDRETGGRISLRVVSDLEMLTIEVEDNGGGIQSEAGPGRPKRGKGIGLVNIQERLELLYKGRARFETFSSHPHGTMIRITLPLLISNPHEKGGPIYVEGDHRRG